jgi:hypothetical protein
MSGWIFEDKILKDEDIPEKAIAFLYLITHIETGRWYIGRKNLFKKSTKMIKNKIGVSKKKRLLLPSDWKDYWSSSDHFKEFIAQEGKNKFKREILIFVETASATIYGEEYLLYTSGSMFDPLCFNGHIRTKIMKSWFETKEADLHDRLKNLKIFK